MGFGVIGGITIGSKLVAIVRFGLMGGVRYKWV